MENAVETVMDRITFDPYQYVKIMKKVIETLFRHQSTIIGCCNAWLLNDIRSHLLESIE